MDKLQFDFELSAADAVKRWDEMGILWTIEMGGLGPGYEQTIQVCAIEILRDALAKGEPKLSPEEFQKLADETMHFHNESLGGLSGAQAGAATQLAFKAYDHGWSGMLKSALANGVEDERFTQISKRWPHAKERT